MAEISNEAHEKPCCQVLTHYIIWNLTCETPTQPPRTLGQLYVVPITSMQSYIEQEILSGASACAISLCGCVIQQEPILILCAFT